MDAITSLSTTNATDQLKQDVSMKVLDRSLEMANKEAEALTKMMEFRDPMTGNIVDTYA